ncbi:protein-L-isoaspartate O-methyltransferase-like [Diaphorina citri]|uniref:protein-L-isoaspartate(D-aspartate) O-methyltransferase n=1 Tax=Diaphorina citri TaxID=121845 RepID=A0A3Q0J0L9_DIACI|nr:protein-L-isoaspartate O-methyltransferase-like [Diaphorina citri]
MYKTKELRDLMIKVDRKDFCPPNRNPYHDYSVMLENCSYLNSPSFVKFDMYKTKELRDLMIKVDRKDFCPPNRNPYHDYSVMLENCSYLNSPSFIASSLEPALLKLKPGDTVLDVGTGSGYTAACLGYMVRPHGKVYSLDHMEYLVNFSKENIRKNHAHLLDEGVVNIMRK